MHLKIQSGEKIKHDRIQMVLPGSEIPEWFGDKGIGSSLTIQLPSNCHQLKGIAFCLVFLLPLLSHDMLYASKLKFSKIYLECHVQSKNGDSANDEDDESKYKLLQYNVYGRFSILNSCDSDHMFLHYELGFVDALRKYSGKEVTFKFYNRMSDGESHKIEGEIEEIEREKERVLQRESSAITANCSSSYYLLPRVLDAFLAPGSELWMFNDVPENEREKKLIDGGLDFTIQADPRSLATLLLIRDIQSKRLLMVNQVRRASFSQGSWIGEMQHVEKCLQSAENVALFIEHLNFEFLISRNKTLFVI
ncbi:hypothetical protein OIU85_003101 [Salix viminalis]|uniref:C-JID domain-containing protein n=1 Tax=Salix viminalis TaxID=40686 RepID=A0A9Q0PYE5_SALVM|nr:hypothetical protein OIU85_003101 [Salix viminalis]